MNCVCNASVSWRAKVPCAYSFHLLCPLVLFLSLSFFFSLLRQLQPRLRLGEHTAPAFFYVHNDKTFCCLSFYYKRASNESRRIIFSIPLPQFAKGKILRQADFTITSATGSILNLFSSMNDQNHRNTLSNRMHLIQKLFFV